MNIFLIIERKIDDDAYFIDNPDGFDKSYQKLLDNSIYNNSWIVVVSTRINYDPEDISHNIEDTSIHHAPGLSTVIQQLETR